MERRSKKEKNNSISNKVRVRHHCYPKGIVEINRWLSDVQRKKIETTPFKSLLNLNEKFELCGPLLSELLMRWDDRRRGFRIQEKVVQFTPMDACMSLGLRIVGQPLVEDKNNESEINMLFNGEVNVKGIRDLVQYYLDKDDDDDVDIFTRLYIWLGFAEFYFPIACRTRVCTSYFHLLDDLQEIDTYSWGLAVYEFLVKGLNNVAEKINSGSNAHEVNLNGCAAVIQIWAMEHIAYWPKYQSLPNVQFPRLLSMPFLNMQTKSVTTALKKSKIITDVVVLDDDMCFEIVREALQHCGKNGCSDDNPKGLMERIQYLEEEVKSLKEKLKERCTCDMNVGEDSSHANDITPFTPPPPPIVEEEENINGRIPVNSCMEGGSKGKKTTFSNMYVRRKKQPRIVSKPTRFNT